MGRAILAVIGGYVLMFVAVLVSFAVAYLVLGADGSFKEGTYDITVLWGGVSIVLGLAAAVAGGVVAAMIAKKGSNAPKVLAGVVLVVGLVFSAIQLTSDRPDPGPRVGEVGFNDAMMKAEQPTWFTFMTPVLSAVGVLVGAGLCCGRCGKNDAGGNAAKGASDSEAKADAFMEGADGDET